MSRRLLSILTAVLVVAASATAPMAVLAGGPPGSVRIPPLRADGPVVLPNGRVLPVRPAWAQETSVQAEMLKAHAGDKVSFAPGELPRGRGPNSASLDLALADGSGSTAVLGLAGTASDEAALAAAASLPNGMRKEVLGFLPYWMLSADELQWMQYQLVTTIAYFAVAARSDGTLAATSGGTPTSGWSGWNSSAMTGVINAAHARGVRVVLTVSMMAWDSSSTAAQGALLGSATARAQLVSAIVAAVQARSADGVNLDFEPVSTTLRDQYTSFVRQLKTALVAAGAGYLTVCTMAGAATWATGYDLAGLTASGAADAVFVMGYDYSWSGSARAGGVAPMDSPYMLDVGDSVDDYLGTIPGSKIIWGVPYYGRTWQTTTGDLNAPTRAGASGASKAYYYAGARSLAGTHGRRWDSVGKVPWFAYYDTPAATWVEGYYDDAVSLAAKYDMVNQRNLAGAGMWTLLMDQGDNALWGLLAAKFANDTSPPSGGIGLLPAVAGAASIPVSWAATDVGSGVRSYSVQVRDRAQAAWVPWLTNTTSTSASFVGLPGHAYEFRLSAVDYKGNAQPWQAPAAAPGTALAVGGFARVGADALNVRAGAGTGFGVLDQLNNGDVVAILGGPISAGGYQWYEVQFGFDAWPSAAYPRLGWLAAGSGTTAYLSPAQAPNVISIPASMATVPPATVAPSVVGRYPAAGATGISAMAVPAVRFSRVVSGVNGSSFVLRRSDGTVVPATVFNTGDSLQWGLRPSAVLVAGTTYTLSASAAIGSVEGGQLTPTSWSFTVAGTPPPPGTTTYSPARNLTFLGGTHTGYRFDGAGHVTASKAATLTRTSSAPTSQRRDPLPGQTGAWFYVTAGIWAGYWVRESPSAYLPGISSQASFSPARSVAFAAGTYTGYRFDSAGHVTASRVATLTRASGASAGSRAIINGRPYLGIVNGIWAGYWVAESASVSLR